MKKTAIFVSLLFLCLSLAFGQVDINPYAGTAMPYPVIKNSSLSSSGMHPFYLNHLGRHGARFPTSGKAIDIVVKMLTLAEQERRLTEEGTELLCTVRNLHELFNGRWGSLSPLGEEEQTRIAERMIEHYPRLFAGPARIEAIATYVPRCIKSMDVFLSSMKLHNPSLQIEQSEGRRYDPLLRFFDMNKYYVQYKEKGKWIPIYETFVREKISPAPVMKKFFSQPGQETEEEARKFVLALFSIAAILPSTGIPLTLADLFTVEEWQNYWSTQNLRQYMRKSAAPIGNQLPVAIAWPLLAAFVQTSEKAIDGQSDNRANFRFAHAETVIPFVALMGIKKTDAQIENPDSVSIHWKDYEIAPMAANVQWIFYRDKKRRVWIKILLNEKEAALPIFTDRFPYYRWKEVDRYLHRRIRMAKKILSLSDPSQAN